MNMAERKGVGDPLADFHRELPILAIRSKLNRFLEINILLVFFYFLV